MSSDPADYAPPPEPDPTPLVRYNPTEAEIRGLARKFEGLAANVHTPQGYDRVKMALRELVPLRTGIEKTRQRLNSDAIAWKARVDQEAKRLTALILTIENPLKAAKAEVDEAEERAAEKARAEAEAFERKQAEEKARQEQEKQRAAREAEQAAMRAERERMEEERKAMQAERDRLAAEQAAKAEEVRKLAEELERERRERQEAERKAQAEARAREEQERQKKAEEELRQQKAAAEEARKKYLETIRPDCERLQAFADRVEEFWAENEPKELTTEAAKMALYNARTDLGDIFAQMVDL